MKIQELNPKSFFFNEQYYSKCCKDKNSYDTEWQVKFAADECFKYSKKILDWYLCPFCNKWHLTSD